MSTSLLGEQIDIHGGGRDLVFPHHENEIAQAETASGLAPFCGWWMHNGMVQLDGVKMSKSLGNLVLVRDLLQQYEPDHLRLYLLSSHYRDDANYHDAPLNDLAVRYQRLKAAATAEGAVLDGSGGSAALLTAFQEAMDDDLDTPRALALMDEAAARVGAGVAVAGEQSALREALSTMGFAFAGARGPANGDLNP
jgi:cysteinyl-tRNA synthetase